MFHNKALLKKLFYVWDTFEGKDIFLIFLMILWPIYPQSRGKERKNKRAEKKNRLSHLSNPIVQESEKTNLLIVFFNCLLKKHRISAIYVLPCRNVLLLLRGERLKRHGDKNIWNDFWEVSHIDESSSSLVKDFVSLAAIIICISSDCFCFESA